MSEEKVTAMPENKMGTMSLGKLLLQMSLPMMISMFVQSLYNIIDSIFVARISEDALTAVSLAFPIQNLLIAVGVGTGVGINSLLSRRLGERRQDAVDKTALNGVFIALCSAVVFVLIGIFVPHVYFESQTTNTGIIDYGVTYMRICLIVSVGIFGSITFERLLQSTGKMFLSMISQLTGTVFNLVFDPLLIFGLCGFPKLGIAGAAIATVLGQIAAMIVSAILNLTHNKEINFSFKGFRPDGTVIKDIYAVGVPSVLLGSVGSVMVYFLNLILGSFSTTAIAVFGVYFKLQSFIFMPVFGLNNGAVPIIAYNFGAKKKHRIIRAVKLSSLAACCIMIVGTLLFELFPGFFLGLFNASDEMLSIGIPALRIIALHFPIAAFCIVFGCVFQAVGEGLQSMLVSFIRQLIVLLPVAWLLSLSGKLNFVWWAFPIAELSSLAATVLFLAQTYKKYIKDLPD